MTHHVLLDTQKNPVAAAPSARFEHSGFFVFRTPLLPVEEFTTWSQGLALPGALDGPDAPTALASDLIRLRAYLKNAFDRPEMREALWVASPSLAESYPIWLRAPDSDRGQRVERALVRYFSRMVTRSTPFGLFAGVSVGVLGDHSELLLESRKMYRRHARLDMYFLSELVQTLTRNDALRRELVYRPNSSLYRAGPNLRYATAYMARGRRSYELVRLDPSEYLDTVLERARDGAKLTELQKLLLQDPEITAEEADDYLRDLVDSQVLVPDLEPAVTGPEPIHALVAELAKCAASEAESKVLDGVRVAIDALNALPLGEESAGYQAIAETLQVLPPKVDVGRLFQVDMVKPIRAATLGPTVLTEALRCVDALRRLASVPTAGPVEKFRDAFVKRYERREVPLVEVLDEEFGIGLGSGSEFSPLLAGIILPPAADDQGRKWTNRDDHLLERLKSLQPGEQEIELSEDDLVRLGGIPASLPDSVQFFFLLEAESDRALDEGRFRLHARNVSGPTGVTMLGRFCHVDPAVHDHVTRHIRQEESRRPDAIFAEIVHLPDGRMGNILHRPVLRSHEIVYLGRSGAPLADQIPISDLFVSVEGGRVVLRSALLNKEVLPRLTSAHNVSRGLPIYRFLSMLQSQGRTQSSWFTWGSLAGQPFLPRVVIGKSVLAPATWNLRRADLERLQVDGTLESLKALQLLRRDRRIPRYFGFVESDNVLFVDSDNALSAASFIDLVKHRASAQLSECASLPGQLCVRGPEGTFFHEIVLPLLSPPAQESESAKVPQSPPPARVPARSPLRCHVPGSEWMFIKLYCGSATLDQLLCDVVSPIVKEVTGQQLVRRWFFIRYGDPDWHVRVRFNGPAEKLWSTIAPRLNELAGPYLADGRVWKVQFDTYDREIERYGGAEAMTLSEDLFCADSDAALEIIDAYRGEGGQDARWKLTLRGMDDMLDDLGLDLPAKRDCMTRVVANNRRARRFADVTKFSISDKYRARRKQLEELFSSALPDDHVLAPGVQALARRANRLKPIAAELRALEERGALLGGLPALCESYLHMEANRFLRGSVNDQELVLYDFLLRTYESRAARLQTKRSR